jgi:hypothetical protein
MYGLVLDAAAQGGWAVTEYEGRPVHPQSGRARAGILAVRGDLRIQVEWECDAAGGRWQRCLAEAAVRDPGHDPADWMLPHPRRWRSPATRDRDRRSPAGGVYPVARLLALPDDALHAAVLGQYGRRPLASIR